MSILCECMVAAALAADADADAAAKELFMLGHVSDTISILTSFTIVCGFCVRSSRR